MVTVQKHVVVYKLKLQMCFHSEWFLPDQVAVNRRTFPSIYSFFIEAQVFSECSHNRCSSLFTVSVSKCSHQETMFWLLKLHLNFFSGLFHHKLPHGWNVLVSFSCSLLCFIDWVEMVLQYRGLHLCNTLNSYQQSHNPVLITTQRNDIQASFI